MRFKTAVPSVALAKDGGLVNATQLRYCWRRMELESPRTAELRYNLVAEGFYMTKLRKALLEIFAKDMKPFSVDEIQGHLQKFDAPVHKVSLYRELEVLVNAGVINPIYFHDHIKRYEFAEHKHHHHVVCIKCNAIADVDVSDDFDDLQYRIEKKSKFTILRHSLEFFGLCKNCVSA